MGRQSAAGLAVEEGSVYFQGQGINANNIDHFDVISRKVVLEAKVRAKDISFFVGKNNFDYSKRRIISQRMLGINENSPAWALDASALGSMYTDRIYLESTENGVGVRMAGDMAANAHDIVITSSGNLALKAKVYAKKDISLYLAGQNAGIEDSMSAEGKLNVNAEQLNVRETAVLFSKGDMRLDTTQTMHIEGDLHSSDGTLDIDANQISMETEAKFFSKGNMTLHTSLAMNIKSDFYTEGVLSVSTDQSIALKNTGILFSKGDLNVNAVNFTIEDGGEAVAGVNSYGQV